MVVIESAGLTDLGKKRQNNEDALFLDEDHRLYIVADGMGGHQAGEVASAMVIDTIRDFMTGVGDASTAEKIGPQDETLSDAANRLVDGIRLANTGVYRLATSDAAYKGMGSTVAAAYFTDDTLIVANVGDSPIYLIHNGAIELLSVTHNVFTEQMAINPNLAKRIDNAYKRMLTRGMGIAETVEPDTCELQFFDNDMLVLSSDGLSDKVKPDEILDVASNSASAESACQRLVDLANDRGGEDNITVIILKINTLKPKSDGFIGTVVRFLFPWKR
jgi:serine/threonine protein phosphatase PrpC